MKILFLGDYSNVHACLAAPLRAMGHQVTVASDGGRYMDTDKDILISRNPGLAGTIRYGAQLLSRLPLMRGYDVVQLVNPHFLHLRPRLLRKILTWLKKENGSLFLTLAGNDYRFVEACMEEELFRFSEFRVGNELTEFERATCHGRLWMGPGMKEYNKLVYDTIDGAMSVLPEYDMAARPLLGDRLAFTNIPIDLDTLPYAPAPINQGEPLRIMVGMKDEMAVQKGTGQLLALCRRLEKEMPERIRVEKVSGLPLREYLARMRGSHMLLDQLYSYSPATNALQAMAQGSVAGSGGQPEYYLYLRAVEAGRAMPSEAELRFAASLADSTAFGKDHPVLALSPLADTELQLRNLIGNPELLEEARISARRLVERHNASDTVAARFLGHWEKQA